MSLNENKESTQSEAKSEKKKWKAWEKNLLAGTICFTVGLTAPIAVALNVKSKTNTIQIQRIENLEKENKSLKEQLETQKEKVVTVPVYVTESIKATEKAAPEKKETAPVTDVPETEKPVLKTESPVTEADNSDRIREITNPLTKIPPYKVKPPAPAKYTIYWLDVERSDLAGMTADDFAFFTNYINEKYNTDDNVYFYVRMTDYPDVIFEFFIPTYGMMTANIGISKEDTDDHCYRMDYNSCYMDFDDPSQIKLTGIKKDEYKLPVEDEDEIYYFSEFNEDMFNQIQKFQEHAKFLWG